MNITCFHDARAFFKRTETLLLKKEAENNLTIGIVLNALDHPERFSDGLFLAVLEEGGEVRGAAVMTPPYPVVLAEWPTSGMPLLLHTMKDRELEPLSGVLGPPEIASAFAKAHCLACPTLTFRAEKRMRIYRLDEVLFPEMPPPGRMRVADAADAEVAAEFAHGFYEVARDHFGDVMAVVKTAIEEQRLFLWETDAPVSMAAWVRDTPNSKAVALVFTPERERRKGYASSLVAQVCHRALNSGKRHCVLFADLDNPTSNHIYQVIGFKPVSDNVHLVFEP